MDPSLRSSLFNQMIQALELSDKRTADQIESLIRNFHPDSPTPIFVYIPSYEEDFVPNIPSPSSFDSDSPMTTRSSKPSGSRRRASRAPRGSLLDAQTTVDSDVDDHQKNRLHFSADHPCSFDCEINVVSEEELRKYKSHFNIPDAVTLILPGDRAAWNPPENAVAIYGAMLSCGVTLPLQPFISRFLPEAQIALVQLAPNSYRILMCLCLMWKLKGYGSQRPYAPRDPPLLYPKASGQYDIWLFFTVCDFDTVCDLQARVVKNSEAASKKHAAGLAKEGIASPDGGDPSDGEEVGDVTGEVLNRGAVSDIPIFDADVPETPLDPASDLNPRTNRGKRLAKGNPNHTARPPKRASRVVQYVVSSDEEGADEPVLAETPSTQTAVPEALTEGASTVVSPLPKGVNESNVSNPTPTPTSAASSPTTAGEPNFSSTIHPGPSGRPGSTNRPGSSKQPGASTSGSGVAREAPPAGPIEAGDGAEFVSLSDFSAVDICSYLINNDVYVGKGWEHVKSRSCNRKIEFFFNCHSLLAAEEKLSAAEEEIRSLKEQLSASQESLVARLEADRLAEEAKEKAEREALDLRNQLSSRDVIFDDLKVVLEVEAVDRFKRSPAYDALLLREFERGMRQSKKFFAIKDHSNEKALRRFDKSFQLHMASAMGSIKEQRKRWKAHCRYTRTEPYPMHLEIPSKRAFNTYYSGQKGSFSNCGVEPNLGPVAGRDYGPFMPDGDEEIVWPSEDEIEDDKDSEDPPTAS
ncbi:hypothetical protein LWI29_007215 [Acer saccharum]|uniref:Uncharacterized protein n=1 Tax=Acer saccharum TaxID=4024 RepID=A0AA39UGP7_ACESA|nr:hypothetical protein LWI29_007215 [Acer saccharum]